MGFELTHNLQDIYCFMDYLLLILLFTVLFGIIGYLTNITDWKNNRERSFYFRQK